MKDCERKDREVRTIAEEIFAAQRYGQGFAYVLNTVMDRSEILERKSSALDPFLNCIRNHLAPDFGIDFSHEGIRENKGLTFVHRKTAAMDIYFVSNIQDAPSAVPITFRITKKRPWKWNPYNGDITPILHFSHEADGVKIPLRLAPYESAFVVFKEGSGPHATHGNLSEITYLSSESLQGFVKENGEYHVTVSSGAETIEGTAAANSIPSPFLISGRWTCCLEGHEFPRLKENSHN